ncbi:hypothetical protein [Pedobacter sp. KACC 23697]|uniref:Carboxypeptidase regulatory-like domain-containing protein n=1 Tax=Pedobacter sp. KACC 23697 TaxID=3149230 RepID=A0AAU7K7S0_9SPHI
MMKNKINEVSIAGPCTQNWDEMAQSEGFNFCKVCSKNVIDFSGYTNAEIIGVLANAGSALCGRMSQSQLNQLNYHLAIVPANNKNRMKYLGVLAIGMSIFMTDAKAENLKEPFEIVKSVNEKRDHKKPIVPKRIFGYVIGADKKPVVGIKLSILDTKYATLTDKNGRYEIILHDKFDTTKNQLVVESILYPAFLRLDFSKEKQTNLQIKKAEPMIMGRMIITSKKK